VVLSATFQEWAHGVNGTAFHDLVFLNAHATLFDIHVLAIGLCPLSLAIGGIEGERARGGLYPLLLISVLGIMLTALAVDLLVVYLGLEMVLLPLWALTMLGHCRGAGVEVGVNFLILGLIGSRLVLFATVLLYGAAGNTALQLLVESLSSPVVDEKLVVPGVVLLLTGLLP